MRRVTDDDQRVPTFLLHQRQKLDGLSVAIACLQFEADRGSRNAARHEKFSAPYEMGGRRGPARTRGPVNTIVGASSRCDKRRTHARPGRRRCRRARPLHRRAWAIARGLRANGRHPAPRWPRPAKATAPAIARDSRTQIKARFMFPACEYGDWPDTLKSRMVFCRRSGFSRKALLRSSGRSRLPDQRIGLSGNFPGDGIDGTLSGSSHIAYKELRHNGKARHSKST